MSRLLVENIRHEDASTDALVLDNAGNIQVVGNVISVTGNINSAGNIGAGTTTPFARSHIKDTSWSSGSPYGTVALIEGNNVNDNNWGHLVITDTTTANGNGGSIRFATGAASALNPFSGIQGTAEGASWGGIGFDTRPENGTATRRLTIDSIGNVGIGTSSPERDGTTTSLAVSGGGSKSASLDLYGTVKNYAIYSGGSGQLGFYNLTDSSEAMTINSSGNVGIGTGTPGEKLEVAGTLQIKNPSDHPAMRFMEGSDTRGYFGSGDWAVNGGDQADFGISSAGSGSLLFGTSGGVNRMLIQSDGKVRFIQMPGSSATQQYYNTGWDGLFHFRFSMSMTGSVAYVIRMTGFSNGIHKVKCAASHWTGSYMTYRESYLGMDVYTGMTENNIMNQNSGAQGNWSFSRPATGKLDIVKSAGTYVGGMQAMIEIVGPRNVNIEQVI